MLINVESGPALASLPSLLAVPSLDGVFIGPHDLSVQLGVPEAWGHEVRVAAFPSVLHFGCEA